MTLDVGGETLTAFVVGYRYEEKAQEAGGLTIWLDNRGDEFDDLAGDYPLLVRGAAVDLRRGLPVAGVDTVVKLPRTWVDGLRYVLTDEGAGLLEVQCIDWWGRLRGWRYASATVWVNTEVHTIATAILSQVGLTIAAGAFGVLINFDASVRRDGDEAIRDLMGRVEEYLYAGEDGQIEHKELDPAEAVTWAYDWSVGGGANHPLLEGTEVAETSPRFNKVVVVGGPAGGYSGSAEDAVESALVGTRLRTVMDRDLSSDAECAERAQAELRYWQAQQTSGTVRARPNMCLRIYDVLSVAAPPIGGPAVAKGRVTAYVEQYGRGIGKWEQVITLGKLPARGSWSGVGAGAVTDDDIDESAWLTALRYLIRDGDDVIQSSYAEVEDGTGTTGTHEAVGKDAGSPESILELIAKTFDGAAAAGVGSVTITLDTETGKISLGGLTRLTTGAIDIEMTEIADPGNTGANRVRLYARDNGAGKTQYCAVFDTGAVQVLATEP